MIFGLPSYDEQRMRSRCVAAAAAAGRGTDLDIEHVVDVIVGEASQDCCRLGHLLIGEHGERDGF